MQNTATNKQFADIFAITLAAVQQYTDFCKLCEVDDDLDTADLKAQVNTHFDDVAYITSALAQFAQTKNMQDLHASIMQQDTFVREYFIRTLEYIEHSKNYTGYCACL
jgi:glutathione synthase/RimK-type ligase-like ATP-grasp enzyme